MTVRKMMLILICMILILAIAAAAMGIGAVVYVLVPYEERAAGDTMTTITSFDGTELAAKMRTAETPSHKWVILVHGYRADHTMMNAYGDAYFEKGYNVLQPDNRAHGASGGKYIGMGYLDQYDIAKWIDFIIERDADAEIVLHGVSMGAAAIMMLSGQESLAKNVKVLIEDCGYVSARDYLTWKLKQRFSLPSFPIIPIANIAFKAAAGYYMNDASAIDALASCDLPILFIHGDKDTTVSVENVYKLYDAAKSEKALYVAEGAGHSESLAHDEERYWNEVFGFIERVK